jgi:putative membrane protein (TIGR04086 family)
MRGVRPWKSIWFRAGISTAEGMLFVLAGAALLALLILRLGLPSARVLRFAARMLWTTGAFLAGRRCGRHGRRHGLAEGALCGCLLTGAWFCGSLLLHEIPGQLWIPALLLPASGACGGVLGVNTPLRRSPD